MRLAPSHRAASTVLLVFAAAGTFASAYRTPVAKRHNPAAPSPLDTANTNLFFDQLLDHSNPSAGTFKQRYFFSQGAWTGSGAPIVLNNPGEQTADGFSTDLTSPYSLQHALMQSLGAAGVVLEREYSTLPSQPGVCRLTTRPTRPILGPVFAVPGLNHGQPTILAAGSSH